MPALMEEKNSSPNELSGLMAYHVWDLSVSLTQQRCIDDPSHKSRLSPGKENMLYTLWPFNFASV